MWLLLIGVLVGGGFAAVSFAVLYALKRYGEELLASAELEHLLKSEI